MGQGRRFQAIALLVLLIATAIQGITPDAQDLASLKALRLICLVPANSTDLADEDESPDIVCGPAQPVMNLRMRRADRVPLPRFVPTDLSLGLFHSNSLQLPCPDSRIPRADGLIHILCRLTC